jgi:hypothetical protein
VQFPLVHWLPPLQAWPFARLAVQLPPVPVQKLPVRQFASVLQVVGHPPVLHTYGAQSCVDPTEQLPAPEQNALGWNTDPEQNAAAHIMLLGACWHAPPVQRPVLPHGGLVGHSPCGSAVPLVTAVHVPLPVRLHAWQVPHTLDVQQTPSTQLPVPHSLPVPQVAPFAFFATHALAAQ